MTHTYSITGMTCTGCADKVKDRIDWHPDVTLSEISLEKNEAMITMNQHVPIAKLQDLFGGDSKYSITEKGHHMMEKTVHGRHAASDEEKSWLETFRPLLTIFLFITMVSVINSMQDGQLDVMQWMNTFMAGFFLVFSFFKLLDVKAFADSYSTYDLLAKRVKGYGYVYPFIELALGLAYLIHFEPEITYVATIVIMGFSSIGVIQSVLDKKKIKCACLGAVFNVPMTTVTIIEDLLMVVMAVFMLWTV